MPTAPRRPCRKIGCDALVTSGFCAKHRREERARAEAERPSARQRGYDSRWQRYRLGFLARHPLCELECQAQGLVTAATVVDHITPHRGDRRLFWDRNNHQAACKRCHDRKTAREDGGWGRGVKSL
jgi:5-methylcytosine-specific restriction protein A